MMDGRVILLNSGKTDAYLHLAKFVPATGIDVITERKIHCTVSVEHESALCQ